MSVQDKGKYQKKVLIVDDNVMVQNAVRHMLENKKCEVVIANNGLEAVNLFDSSFDIVVMDYQMPEMNGIQAIINIRQKEKNLKAKKFAYIVGLTALKEESIIEAFTKAGANLVLQKPLKNENIERIMMVEE